MKLTKTEEKRLILLLSIIDIGGFGTKKQVLDNIENKQLMSFSVTDLEVKHNRNELHWRNDLAFVRKWLVDNSYVEGKIRDKWEITQIGIEYFFALMEKAKGFQSFEKISTSGMSLAYANLENINIRKNSKYKENFKLPEELSVSNNYYEGSKIQITINAYERNSEAREKCIEEYGTKCYICGFDFQEKFGEIGRGYIHVHHIKPLSEIGQSYIIDPVERPNPPVSKLSFNDS